MSCLPEKVEKRILDNFFKACYSSCESVPEMLTRFSQLLKSDTDIPEDIAILLENAIYKYRDILTNPIYLADFRTISNEIHDVLSTTPGITSFKMEGRYKSAINSIEKFIKLLKEGRPLNLLDALGIRIVLFGKKEDEVQSQDKLYIMCNTIINFLLNNGFTLCERDNLPKQEKLDDGINIVVPPESKIPEKYRSCVKDMVFNHKKNGYQSIQMVFRAQNGAYIEIQLRTEEMHIHAEYFQAAHNLYKLTEYTDGRNDKRLKDKIDLSKINLTGFRYLGSKEKQYTDYSGLINSLRIYFRTFTLWNEN